MKRLLLLSVVALSACDGNIVAPPLPPVPVDTCEGLSPITAMVVPDMIRVNGAAAVSAKGGTGRYSYKVTNELPVGVLQGTRYVAALRVGEDTITVSDDCGNSTRVAVVVTAAFQVQPQRSRVAPGTSITLSVTGAKGAVSYAPQGGSFGSGATMSGNTYTAGATAATDIILVKDTATGDQAAVVVEVSTSASFRPATPRVSLPTSSFVPLSTIDGSGVVTWRIASGPGTLEQRAGAQVYVSPATVAGSNDAVLEVTDNFLANATAQVKVRLLTELTRPELVAQGRRSDVATLLTADFDGDGIDDVALGVPESDLNRPQGGAVFIFKGSASGFPEAPTWTIAGQSDTAQFGAVMAAGDLDGDGKADLAISAPGDDVTIADSGAVYLFGIGPDGPRQLRSPLTGLGRGNFGAALAIGDVDGDGNPDLVVGSPAADLTGGAFNTRGVVDVFLLKPGMPIPDLGEIRIGGYDLDADGGTRRFSGTRAGRALVAEDLNGDSRIDLAILSTVNFSQLAADGGTRAGAVNAVQVHLGRDATKKFEDTPDLYVVPANIADSTEGTWRLGFIPAGNGRPALLATAADQTDSPNLSASDAGTSGGTNAGGVLLFDLSSMVGSGAAPTNPRQLTRLDAWSRIYGSQGSIQASRSFAAFDADGDAQPELVLGAPYASRAVDAGVTFSNTGRLEFFSLSRLSAGSVVNRPDFSRGGESRVDILGTAVTGWNGRVVALNHRASTSQGDYTGRLDVFSAGNTDPLSWSVQSVVLPNKPGGQQFGACIEVGKRPAGLAAIVGVPAWSGAGSDGSGGETGAGRAIAWSVSTPNAPVVIAEGANTAYQTDAGVRAFGGRGQAVDVAMTDFDKDGIDDLVVAAPNFSIPGRTTDGGVNSTEYATNRVECSANGQTTGAVFVHLGQSDGTYREGFRVWAMRDIGGCTVPDGGTAAMCQRTQLSRNGVIGRFDFDGDMTQDLAVTRSNGLEIFRGRAPDDMQLNKPSMVCDSYYSFPFIAQATTAPAALGDLNGDGCDELGFRYADNNRQGVIVLYGFGSACATNAASWVRVSGDVETGVAPMRLGIAMTRASGVLADNRDAIAVTADLYPFAGDVQPTVLLLPVTQLNALKPASGGVLVAVQGTAALTPVPLVPTQRALGFGRSLAGGVDVDGDGRNDLVVSAPGASVNGDGTGAVYVFKGGTVVNGANQPALLIVADPRERASFGQDLSLSPAAGAGVPAALGIGAPLSYRWGTSNGTAFVLPLDF